jgi:hypothetical protein
MLHVSPTADQKIIELHREPVKPAKKWQRVWVNKKLLVVAIAIELIIVGAVLFAGWQFAERYSGDDEMQWWMAIICGISYAAVELARVPLAITAATHRRRLVRWFSVFVLMFAVVITTKSLSQIGEQMFSQRLVEVNKARTTLEIAEADNKGAIQNDANKHDRIEALDNEIEKLLVQLKEFGKPPEPKFCTTTTGKRGVIKNCKMVTPPWQGVTIQQQLLDARARRNAMDSESELSGKQRDQATAKIAAAKGHYQVAVMDSQLHSFAGMLFMKSPSNVTDDEIAKIKLFFVFIGALAGAMTATGLAYCSFTRHPEPKPEPKPRTQIPNVNILPALRELANDLKLEKAKANG